MRPQKIFLHFLTDSSGKSFYTDGYDTIGNPIIKSSNQPRFLSYSPEGWKDNQLSFARNAKYHGINRTFVPPYKFVEDGADIIRYLLYTKGSYEQKLYLNINKWNDANDIYEPYYKGELDLTQASDDPTTGITCNLIEGGFFKILSAGEDLTFEIPFDELAEDLSMDGIELFSQIKYQVVEFRDWFLTNHAIPVVFLNNEGIGSGIQYQGQNYEDAGASGYSTTSENWTFETDTEVIIHLLGTIKVHLFSSNNVTNDFFTAVGYALSSELNVTHFFKPDGTAGSGGLFGQRINEGDTATFPVDCFVTVPAGEKLFILGRAFADTAGDGIEFDAQYDTSDFRIELTTRKPATVIKVYRPLILLEKLIKLITKDDAYTVSSTLLNTYRHLVATCGDAIRGIEGATIKTNFTDFFKSYGNILFAGCNVAGFVLNFEDRAEYYDPTTVTLDAGETKDLQVSIAADLLCNQVKTGYPNQSYNDLNGRKEFNTTAFYSLPVNKIKNVLDITSTYRADPYGIEYTRINLEGKTTTDNDSDNDVFIINVEDQDQIPGERTFQWDGVLFKLKIVGAAAYVSSFPDGSNFKLVDTTYPDVFDGYYTVVSTEVIGDDIYIVVAERPDSVSAGFEGTIALPLTLRREAYTELLGDLPDSIFNIEDLTPKRILFKWGGWIRSLVYFLPAEKIVFQTIDKNKELSTTLDGVTITEKANERIDKLNPILFYPYYFSEKTKVPATFLSVMNDALNGHIKQTFFGRDVYGFPMQMSVKPAFNEAQEWKQLMSPQTDITIFQNLQPSPLNNDLMSTYGLSVPLLSPVQFVPLNQVLQPQYNFKHMDSDFFIQQVQMYTAKQNYFQKWQQNDIIKLQCYTNNLGPVQLDIIDCHGKNYGTIAFTQIVTSAPADPYILYEGNVTVLDLAPGIYYFILTAGTGATIAQFISEGQHVAEYWEDTMLFNYRHQRNKLETFFSTGYNPDFRVEALLLDFEPGANFTTYEDEPADLDLLEGIPFRKFKLAVGHREYGVPPYVADKINRIMLLSNVTIDGKEFTREDNAQMEAERVVGLPTAFWALNVREGRNRQSVTMTVDGELQNSLVVVYNIDTGLFGDKASNVSSNVVQVIEYEELL